MHHAEVTGHDLIGNYKRDKTGAIIGKERESIHSGEDVPAVIDGPTRNAMFGIPTYVDPGPSPESIFAAETKRQRHEEFVAGVKDRFASVLARKQAEEKAA
jgi:hypothetical protein